MSTFTRLPLTFLLLAAAMPAAFAQEGRQSHFTPSGSEIIHHRMNEQGHASFFAAPTGGSTAALSSRSKLTNHGGQVITTPTAYIIWYGNWAQSNGTDTAAGQQIVTDFFQAIGGSPYYKINSTYTGSGITGNVTYGGATTVTGYPHGASLSDAVIQTIVSEAITGGHLPNDANGIYFVLTSSDVTASSGFCTQYCGWHSWGTINGSNHRFAFVGNAARCITACAAQSTGPNGNAGVDGMVSVLAHELEEAATDPDGRTWFARTGAENGDDCAWTFGTSTLGSNGAYYNVTLGARHFLIQRNVKFVGTSQFCLMQ